MTIQHSVIAAFSPDQVALLTGLTKRQLAYWDKTGFFRPQYVSDNPRAPYSRIYSFLDLVGLRTLSVLKNAYGVSMHHLKEVADKLSKHTDRPWSEIKLAVWNRQISWIEPDTGKTAAVISGQYVIFPLEGVIEDMTEKACKLKERPKEELGKIIQKRNISHNKPVFAGTRIPVEAVKNFAKAGYSVEEILKEYPSLSEKDVKAAIKGIPSPSAA